MSAVMAELPQAETMLADAERATGLSDWGGDALFEPEFRALFAALRDSALADAQLTDRGLAGVDLRLRTMAETRLAIIEDRKRHPGIAAQRIVAPIIILGLPRAGSTFLHNLLAQDPANRAPLSWEMLLPSPPPTGPDAARIALAEDVFDAIGLFAPEMAEYHAGGANLPEECSLMMEHVAWADNLAGLWKVSGYNRARAAIDPRAAYETHRMVLQHLQFGAPGRRFLLKFPGHLFNIPTLLATYPDALLVQTHRDPAKVMPSVTATIAAMRRQNSALSLNEPSIARGNSNGYAAGLAAAMQLRGARPEIDARFCDVHFRRLTSDPIGTARMIYDRFGLPLADEALSRMEASLAHSDDHVARRKFTLAGFGLSEARIEDSFAAYIDHYGIERERPA